MGGVFGILTTQLLAFFILASLVCNTAAGFAGRLARGLALAAAAVFRTVAKVAGFYGMNVFHFGNPPKY